MTVCSTPISMKNEDGNSSDGNDNSFSSELFTTQQLASAITEIRSNIQDLSTQLTELSQAFQEFKIQANKNDNRNSWKAPVLSQQGKATVIKPAKAPSVSKPSIVETGESLFKETPPKKTNQKKAAKPIKPLRQDASKKNSVKDDNKIEDNSQALDIETFHEDIRNLLRSAETPEMLKEAIAKARSADLHFEAGLGERKLVRLLGEKK